MDFWWWILIVFGIIVAITLFWLKFRHQEENTQQEQNKECLINEKNEMENISGGNHQVSQQSNNSSGEAIIEVKQDNFQNKVFQEKERKIDYKQEDSEKVLKIQNGSSQNYNYDQGIKPQLTTQVNTIIYDSQVNIGIGNNKQCYQQEKSDSKSLKMDQRINNLDMQSQKIQDNQQITVEDEQQQNNQEKQLKNQENKNQQHNQYSQLTNYLYQQQQQNQGNQLKKYADEYQQHNYDNQLQSNKNVNQQYVQDNQYKIDENENQQYLQENQYNFDMNVNQQYVLDNQNKNNENGNQQYEQDNQQNNDENGKQQYLQENQYNFDKNVNQQYVKDNQIKNDENVNKEDVKDNQYKIDENVNQQSVQDNQYKIDENVNQQYVQDNQYKIDENVNQQYVQDNQYKIDENVNQQYVQDNQYKIDENVNKEDVKDNQYKIDENVNQQSVQDNQYKIDENVNKEDVKDNQYKIDENVNQQSVQDNQQKNDQVERYEPLKTLQHIINETSSKSQVADKFKYYIRRFQGILELKKNYGLTLQASAELYKYCNTFRQVREDGNCFYTAFGFQFLSILLFDYSLDQFNEFFNKIKQIELPMKIFVSNTDLKIDDKELEKQLLEEFQQRLTKLKLIEDINQRQEQFHTEFAAYEKQSDKIDGCLYALSTLFFRNYSNYVVDLSEAKDALSDREKLLNWEEECNSNEVVIAELAKQLNIFVQLILIENSTKIVIRKYGINEHHKIILLIKSGHYIICYFKQVNLDILQHIINETSSKRQVADEFKYYIRRFQDKSELKRNYGLTFSASAELYKYCNAFREVRGDGNCFYTAFGFQFLSILLFDYSEDQFIEFFNKIKQIELPMKIFVSNTDLKIDDKELEKQLLEEFQQRLTKLKLIEDINQRQEQFHTEFAAYEKQSDEIDGCLYALSTLFFRNYSNYIVDLSEAKDALFDREKLLNWEEECNSNEVVIAELAKQLNIFVQLILIENSTKIVFREYGINEHHKIILLIKPGHYNIGYKNNQKVNDQSHKNANEQLILNNKQQLQENQEQQQQDEENQY